MLHRTGKSDREALKGDKHALSGIVYIGEALVIE